MVRLRDSDVSPPPQPVYIAGMNDEPKKLTEAARRALAEAEARRAAVAAKAEPSRPAEHQGPKGPEPTRFGDWERKGIVSDF
jgi:hypothetical protein